MPRCPLCGDGAPVFHARARDIEYRTTPEVFAFYRCEKCGILFIDPMPVDRLHEIYPANYYSFASSRRSLATAVKERLDRRRLRMLAASIGRPTLSALDIGGGTGWLLDILKDADPRVVSTHVVDLDTRAETLARAAGHHFHHGRFEDVDVGGPFDLILMLNLIEHVADPRAVLTRARRLLAPDGRILVKTPNFDALDARLFRHRSWGGFHTPRHFVLFRRDSFERLCRDCGLAVVQFAGTQGAPFWSVSVLDELRKLGLVSITAERPAVYHPLMPALQIAAAAFDFLRRPFATLSQMEFVLTSEGDAP